MKKNLSRKAGIYCGIAVGLILVCLGLILGIIIDSRLKENDNSEVVDNYLSDNDNGTNDANKVDETNKIDEINEINEIIKDIVSYVNGSKDAEVVYFHTEAQNNAIIQGKDKLLTYAYGTYELSRPEGITISWKALPTLENDGELVSYTLKFAIINQGKKDAADTINQDKNDAVNTINLENSEFVSVDFGKEESSYTFYNQKLGERYSYEVIANYSNGKSVSTGNKEFLIDNIAPRNLYVDGVTNVRDIGGWVTDSGDKVNQGLVIRGGRLNDDKKEKVSVTEDGINTLVSVFGIKTELDLRQDEIRTESALGVNVNYINIPMPGTVTTQLRKHDEDIKKIIEVFADESNYPIYLHCSIGTDRTGLVTFLINGLLGVSEEDLYFDYAFSNFGKIGSMRDYKEIQDKYVKVIKGIEGNSLQEKIENYLLEIGITKDEIATIKKIMLK
ncbi:MAG: tyrosine-protein phosphatase [Lachnospiraceae bacterium]|nr:tyrosine-protein phosphatase [Lachnospiraceae bacterium]